MPKKLKKGFKARITSIDVYHSAASRLLDLGFTTDAEFTIENVAPLGDPCVVKIRDYLVAIRKSDLNALQLEELSN